MVVSEALPLASVLLPLTLATASSCFSLEFQLKFAMCERELNVVWRGFLWADCGVLVRN